MGTNGAPPLESKWRPSWASGGILRALVIWSVIGIGIGIIVEIIFARLASGAWLWQASAALNSAQWYDVTRSSIATAGLFGLGGAALLAYRRQGTAEKNEKTSARQHKLEKAKNAISEISDLRARYAVAAEQLGHDRPAVRLAGVYAMAALADDWQAVGNLKQQRVCVDVLCAYLRMSYDPGSEIAKSGEKEVRLTIIKTITERLQNPAAPNTWCGFPLDFTGVVFDGGNFSGAQFTGGTVDFGKAQFTGGTVNFAGAKFENVSFFHANFAGGDVNFYGARFTGGNVSFNHAKFTGGKVSFTRAGFTGGKVNFNHAKFAGGDVNFTSARFTGGNVSFNHAGFTGGKVNFNRAGFTGGNVNFNRAGFTGGNVNFIGASGSHKRGLSFVAPRAWTHPPKVPWSDGESPLWVSPDIWPPALASVFQIQEEP